MSLLKEFMTSCVMLDRKTAADGYGGYITEWREGAEFECAIVLDTSMQARVAAKQGVTSLYTITTDKAFILHFNDIFKRLSDGKIFKVTSNGEDKATPDSAGLNMRQVTAEDYTLSGDANNG